MSEDPRQMAEAMAEMAEAYFRKGRWVCLGWQGSDGVFHEAWWPGYVRPALEPVIALQMPEDFGAWGAVGVTKRDRDGFLCIGINTAKGIDGHGEIKSIGTFADHWLRACDKFSLRFRQDSNDAPRG